MFTANAHFHSQNVIVSACGWAGATFFWKDADCVRLFCCPQLSEHTLFWVVEILFVVDDEHGIRAKYIIKVFMYTSRLTHSF